WSVNISSIETAAMSAQRGSVGNFNPRMVFLSATFSSAAISANNLNHTHLIFLNNAQSVQSFFPGQKRLCPHTIQRSTGSIPLHLVWAASLNLLSPNCYPTKVFALHADDFRKRPSQNSLVRNTR